MPMRVVVVSSIEEASNTHSDGPVAHLVRPTFADKNVKHRGPCRSRFREKALEISNALREALGLPLIEAGRKTEGQAHDGKAHILPFIGGPPIWADFEVNENVTEGRTKGGDRVKIISAPRPGRFRPHYRHGSTHRLTFFNRLHFALTALGPWEGRAVAFVLGTHTFSSLFYSSKA